MSDCSPSRSSRASRNTWLSSTRTRRIGPAIRRRLFGREEQRIMGLSAHLDVDLHVWVPLRDLLDEAVELGLLRSGQQGQDATGLAEEPFDDGRGDLLEVRAADKRLS